MNASTRHTPASLPATLKASLEQAGLACTAQRLAIYAALANMDGHPTAEAVFDAVQPAMPTISRDTVYRTLALFEELGLLDRVQVSAHSVRYEPNLHPHHHLVCNVCGEVADFDWDVIETLPLPVLPAGWGQSRQAKVIVRGICPACCTDTQPSMEEQP